MGTGGNLIVKTYYWRRQWKKPQRGLRYGLELARFGPTFSALSRKLQPSRVPTRACGRSVLKRLKEAQLPRFRAKLSLLREGGFPARVRIRVVHFVYTRVRRVTSLCQAALSRIEGQNNADRKSALFPSRSRNRKERLMLGSCDKLDKNETSATSECPPVAREMNERE